MLRFTPMRPGLTRIDVVVLLAIGSLATCLGGCWMQNGRIDGTRTQSLLNLGQISKAAHNWVGSSMDANSLPHAGFVQKTRKGQELKGPYAAILPQMEQQEIFDNGTPDAFVKPYISPSDPTVNAPGGYSSYAWNGAWIMEKASEAKLTPKDGASNTIMLSERVMNCNGSLNKWSGTHPGKDQVGNGKPFIPGVTNASVNTFGTSGKPPAWDTNTPVTSSNTCDNTTPSGAYRSVILVAMGDGSTRIVSNSAGTAQNWSAAITPASEDKFDSNW